MRLATLIASTLLSLGTAAAAEDAASGDVPRPAAPAPTQAASAAPAEPAPAAPRRVRTYRPPPAPPSLLASSPAPAASMWTPPPEVSAAPAPAVCTPGEDASAEEPPPFVTGELANVGQTRLTNRNSRAGVGLGYQHLDGYDYAVLTPGVDLHVRKLSLGVGAPLRLAMCQGDVPLGGCVDVKRRALKPMDGRWSMRSGDWSSLEDYALAVKYLTWGKKEDSLYLDLTQIHAATLGHGGVLRRYFANADANRQRLSGELDAGVDQAGFEAFTNDVLHPNLVGVLGYVRPLAFAAESPLARSFSVGVTYASDREAPLQPRAGADLSADVHPDAQFDRRTVTALGVDAELKLLRTEHWDVKPYVEMNALQGAGSGLSGGVLTRSSFGGWFAMRFVTELRTFDANYEPGYFDTFYEVQKLQYRLGSSASGAAVPLTKWQAVSSRTGPRRTGYYLEGTLAIVRHLALSAGYEGAMAPATRSAYLHAEVPLLDWLQLFATLHRREFENESFLGKGFLSRPNTLFFSGARLKVLPFLFLNGGATQTYVWDPALATFKTSRAYSVDGDIGVEF